MAQWEKSVRASRLEATELCNRYYIAWALVTRADDLCEDQARTAEEVCSRLPNLIDMISAVPEPRPARSRTIRKNLVAALHLYRSSAEVAAGLCKWVVRGPGLSPGHPSEVEAQAAIGPIRQSVIEAAKRLAKAPDYWGRQNLRRIPTPKFLYPQGRKPDGERVRVNRREYE